jgi:hypothetical protein
VKKLIALFIVSGVLLTGIIGCSGTPSSKPPATTPPAGGTDKPTPPATPDKKDKT